MTGAAKISSITGARLLDSTTGAQKLSGVDCENCCGCWKIATPCECETDPPANLYIPCDLVKTQIFFKTKPVFGPAPPPNIGGIAPNEGSSICYEVSPSSDEVGALPEGTTEYTDLSEQFDSCDECCEDIRPCCRPDLSCITLTPKHCASLGGLSLGKGLICADLINCIGPVPGGDDCLVPWEEGGCAATVLFEFYDVSLVGHDGLGKKYSCTGSGSISSLPGGPISLKTPAGDCDPFSCCLLMDADESGNTIIGSSNCGDLIMVTPSGGGGEANANVAFCCGSPIVCPHFHVIVVLACSCPDIPGIQLTTNVFNWIITYEGGCAPTGDFGVVRNTNPLGQLSSCGLIIS